MHTEDTHLRPNVKNARVGTDYLDGLRGVLILIVLQVHIFYLTTHAYYARWHFRQPLPSSLETVRWFFPTFSLVGIFVVVSGYCLMLPVARSADGALVGGVGSYLWRRARRILPPYYVALFLSLAHTMLLRGEYYPPQRPLQAGNLLAHILIFYNINPNWRFTINGPFWSLAPEWQLYLLFPIVLVPLWRWIGTAGLLGVAAVVTAGLMASGEGILNLHPWYLLLFVLGMLTAVTTESTDPRWIRWRESFPWVAVSLALCAWVLIYWVITWHFQPSALVLLPPRWQIYAGDELPMGVATAAAIAYWTTVRRSKREDDWPRILKVLHHPRVMFLGRFSYSHYLIHYPILITTTALVASLHFSLAETIAVAYLVSIPASLGLSYLFFLGVERRFLPRRQGRVGDAARQEALAAPSV